MLSSSDAESQSAHGGVSSRRALFGKAAIASLAAVPVIGMMATPAQAATQTLDAGAREFFKDVLSHEIDHAARLRGMLGSRARPQPTFKNLNTTSLQQFVNVSRLLENTCVGALLGALPLIKSNQVRGVAGEFALVEGRHAGYVNVFANLDVTTQAKDNKPAGFDKPLTVQEVLDRASPFIASLNGGPPATITPGDDVSIMNFALIFEYLGVAFYSQNNPKYL